MYLVVEVVTNQETLPIISLIMIGAVYGLQAAVFILRWKWDMDGWMVFSWGATRVVLGESGNKIIVHVCVSW